MSKARGGILLFAVIAQTFAIAGGAEEVTYADVAPLLKERCTLCHSGPAAPRALRLDTLDGIKAGSERGAVVTAGDPDNSELIRRLKGSSVPRMPMTGPPFLAATEISLFENWIAAGMPEGAEVVGAASEPIPTDETPMAVVTFDKVAAILATRCAKCHTDNGLMGDPPEGYRLTSYDAVISASDRVRIVPGNTAASELLRRIRGQAQPRMPFDGPPYLAESEIALIEQWIADGAHNSAAVPAPMPVGARIRLHGRLLQRWQLDDLALDITPQTRIDKNPRAGDQVRVRGTLRADGSIRVDRIGTR